MAIRLGDLLVQRGVLTLEQRDEVLDKQWHTGRPFGLLAEQMFGVGQKDIEEAWAEQYSMMAERIDPTNETLDPSALNLVDRRQAWQFSVLPLRFEGDELLICTTQEHLPRALKFAGWRLGHNCYFVLAEPHALGEALMRHCPMEGMTPEVVCGDGLAAA